MLTNASFMFPELTELFNTQRPNQQSFPRYNILNGETVDGCDTTVIELAVAGYGRDDISIEMKPTTEKSMPMQLLTIRGEYEKVEREYNVQGISTKNFKQQFLLYESDEVHKCSMENGILSIVIKHPKPTKPEVTQYRIE